MGNSTTVNVFEFEGGKMQATRKPLPEMKLSSLKTLTKEKRSTGSIDPIDSTEWARWGSDGKWPTTFREKIHKVPLAGEAIRKLVALMYGNGLVYFKTEELKNGAKVAAHYDQEIEEFLCRSKIRTKWLISQMTDYRYFMNVFGEMIFSKDKSKVLAIYHKDAEHSRVQQRDEKITESTKLYYSARFANGEDPSKNQRIEIPLLPEFEEVAFIEKASAKKFGYHGCYPTPGRIHYADATWSGLSRKDGYLDISTAVPEIISAMQNNQVRLKYQINIPESYFKLRHPEWDDYTMVKRNVVVDKKVTELNGSLSNTSDAYKSITNVYSDDHVRNGDSDGGKITIIAIDDKTKKDSWVPSSNAADAQIVQGLGLHPSQMGLAPEGGKMGSGSGSDQRESFNTQISLNTIDQMIVLEPLNFISEYNEWGVTFMIDHTHHTTTNDQESGMKPSANSTEVKPAAHE